MITSNSIRAISLAAVFIIASTGQTEIASGAANPGQRSGNTVAGEWILSKSGDKDGRLVKFYEDKGHRGGSYTAADGQEKPISQARLEGDNLYFEVPDLNIKFTLHRVESHFEGRISKLGARKRRVFSM